MEHSVQIEVSCPHCGEKLTLKQTGAEPDTDDRMICPIHGDVSSLGEARDIALEKARNDIVDVAKRIARDSWKK